MPHTRKKKHRGGHQVVIAMTCPEHGVPWTQSPTRYGLRCSCPIDCCTYVYWPEQPTSTPATGSNAPARDGRSTAANIAAA